MSKALDSLTVITAAQFAEMAAVTFDALSISSGGSVLCANERCAEILGLDSVATLLESLPPDLVTPEDHAVVAKAIETQQETPYFITIQRADGTRRRVEIQGRSIDFEGQPARLVAMRDVTPLQDLSRVVDTHRAALRRNESLFRAIFDSTFQLIGLIDLDGLILEINEPAQKVSGISSESIAGVPLAEAAWWQHDPELPPRITAAIAAALAGDFVRFDVTVGTAEGLVIPMDFTLKPFTDGQGEVVMLIAEGRDIREQKEIEGNLRRSELMYRSLVEGMDSGVVLHGLEEGLPIRAFNESALRTLGLTRDEMLGRADVREGWQFICEDGTPMPEEDIPAIVAARTKRSCTGTVMGVTRPDGGVVWLNVNAEPVVVEGQSESIIVTFTDVTHVKQQDAALMESLQRQRDLTQRVHEIQEQERARISRELHDELGQAMTVLRLQVSGLNGMLPDAEPHIREALAEAVASIDETAQLVRRLSQDLRPGILDVFGLAAALGWQTERFDSADLAATFADETEGGDADLPKPLATALFRIYQEALTNCARHAEASAVAGRLAYDDAGDLLLTVQDDGRGLQRGADAGSLGFLNMRERVQPWHGTVKVSGPKGEGTRITVRVPLPVSGPSDASVAARPSTAA